MLSELAFFTQDVPKMTQFYHRLLGYDPVVQTEGLTIFNTGGVVILIHQTYEPAAGELPAENHVAFSMPNVDEISHTLQHEGWQIEVEPNDYDWGRSAYVRDPDGNLVELTAGQ